ncbi:amidase [Fusarium coicis]|nr:amidase [Fusarium coicis]
MFTTNSPPYKWTATQALELLKNDSISVVAYAQSLLSRIQERDRTIKAWAYLDMPTEYGSRIYDGHQPSTDSHAVAILRAAGALIFGSQHTPITFP